VLDEVTCSLDAELEQRVLHNLSCLTSTIISVAHRQPVIARSSRVFRVMAGKVVELVREPSDPPRVLPPAVSPKTVGRAPA
jgi:ABC-type bacteriocin/lantibiotic exporter with double-glycine peptidase domain